MKSLSLLLDNNFERDLQLGYTLSGPHKADLRIKCNGILAEHHISRGQQKLLVCALRLAQGIDLQTNNTVDCVFLIEFKNSSKIFK